MAIHVTCPNAACGKALQVKAEYAGRRVKCPGCQQPFAIPSASTAVMADTPPMPQPAVGPVENPTAQPAAGNAQQSWIIAVAVVGGLLLATVVTGAWFFVRANSLLQRVADLDDSSQKAAASAEELEKLRGDMDKRALAAAAAADTAKKRLKESEQKLQDVNNKIKGLNEQLILAKQAGTGEGDKQKAVAAESNKDSGQAASKTWNMRFGQATIQNAYEEGTGPHDLTVTPKQAGHQVAVIRLEFEALTAGPGSVQDRLEADAKLLPQPVMDYLTDVGTPQTVKNVGGVNAKKALEKPARLFLTNHVYLVLPDGTKLRPLWTSNNLGGNITFSPAGLQVRFNFPQPDDANPAVLRCIVIPDLTAALVQPKRTVTVTLIYGLPAKTERAALHFYDCPAVKLAFTNGTGTVVPDEAKVAEGPSGKGLPAKLKGFSEKDSELIWEFFRTGGLWTFELVVPGGQPAAGKKVILILANKEGLKLLPTTQLGSASIGQKGSMGGALKVLELYKVNEETRLHFFQQYAEGIESGQFGAHLVTATPGSGAELKIDGAVALTKKGLRDLVGGDAEASSTAKGGAMAVSEGHWEGILTGAEGEHKLKLLVSKDGKTLTGSVDSFLMTPGQLHGQYLGLEAAPIKDGRFTLMQGSSKVSGRFTSDSEAEGDAVIVMRLGGNTEVTIKGKWTARLTKPAK